ncbi:MAG: glycosyltransferase family 2 protein [Candidatus Micrarchaeota archaeon]|nr:glycosyltransferase family 2 protein [Candidatus Micrarchaeota archaeon]
MGLILLLYELLMVLIFIFLIALSLRKERDSYRESKGYRPSVLVIVPCKGLDIGLLRNLKSLKGQGYANFKLLPVVDSHKDEAVPEIRKAGLAYMVSSPKFDKGSGKVNAISTAISANPGYDIYVIADSDICTNKHWLELLIRPLADPSVGISTAYPYFRPIGGFWSTVKSVWGFVGEGLMESGLTRFGWGGSLAFRGGILKGRRFATFQECVSDDVPITNMAKAMGYRIAYVKAAQPVVDTADGLPAFWEWANRQTAFSTLGFSRIFAYGVVFYASQILLLVSSLALSAAVSGWFLVLLLPFLLGAHRAYLRARERKLASLLIYPFMNFIYLANLVVAANTKEVRWRGRSYGLGRLSELKAGLRPAGKG